MKTPAAVVGLGYVGLPLACVLADREFTVTGIEKLKERNDLINQGISPIEGEEPGLAAMLSDVVKKKNLIATDAASRMKDAEVIFVCVDTPVDKDHNPNLSSIKGACKSIGQNMSRGCTVSIESTIPPGTMKNVVIPILEKESGLKVGEGFHLLHCPERVMPGKLLSNMTCLDRVLGGYDDASLRKGLQYYSKITSGQLHITNLVAAEIAKTAENAYRDVQIAFANEVALLCEDIGADAFEVRRLVNTCIYRDMHIPGSGVGGYCLPKDSWLLVSGAPKVDVKVIPSARAVNLSMPHHLSDLVRASLKDWCKNERPKVAIMGLAFLRDSDDTRNSPAITVHEDLVKDFEVIVHDPYVKRMDGMVVTDSLPDALKGADCAVFVTDHSVYKTMKIGESTKLMRTPTIVDGRNIFSVEDCKKLGIHYRGIGKGTSV